MSSNSVVSRRSSRLQQKHSPPSPLIDLHPEIWECILKKLTQKEALNLGITNKDFKSKVNNLYRDWVIHLDERCPYLDMIFDLRVKEVKVVKLLNPAPHQSQGTFFKFPDLLTKIDVENSDISGENLHVLLQHKNLKTISISFGDSALQNVFWKSLDPQIGYNFPELFSLEIVFNGCTGESFESNLYERILIQSRIQKLKTFSVNLGRTLSSALIYRLISKLLLSLGQNGTTLKHFSFENSFLGDFDFTGLPTLDARALLQNCSNLELLIISYHREVAVFSNIWERLIENQSKLVHIKFCCPATNLTICTKLCANNFETLTTVSLKVFSPKEEGQFDVSVFRNCVNLKKLILIILLNQFPIEVVNVSTLPAQIETFCLTGFNFYSSDLSSFLKNHGLLFNLFINLSKAGSNYVYYGVNETVLKDILNHSSVKKLMVTQICTSMESSEVEKMNEILSKMGINKMDNILKLILKRTKDSNGNSTWIPT